MYFNFLFYQIVLILLTQNVVYSCIGGVATGLSDVSSRAYLSQWQFPVQSGGEHVDAAPARRRTHGVPKPRPVLRSDAVRD